MINEHAPGAKAVKDYNPVESMKDPRPHTNKVLSGRRKNKLGRASRKRNRK